MTSPLRLLICSEAEADLHAYRRGREPNLQVRIIRGARCTVMDRCMAEFAAALQLPYCFENTWPSLKSSLAELTFAPQTRLILVITCIHRILPRAQGDFAEMLRIIHDFATTAPGKPAGPSGVEVILHTDSRSADTATRRLAETTIAYSRLDE